MISEHKPFNILRILYSLFSTYLPFRVYWLSYVLEEWFKIWIFSRPVRITYFTGWHIVLEITALNGNVRRPFKTMTQCLWSSQKFLKCTLCKKKLDMDRRSRKCPSTSAEVVKSLPTSTSVKFIIYVFLRLHEITTLTLKPLTKSG